MQGIIENSIAEGTYQVPHPHSKDRAKTYIAIGQPRPDTEDPNGDWYCPIFIENFTDGVEKAHGVGSLDSLVNAMGLLNNFFSMHTAACLAFNDGKNMTDTGKHDLPGKARED
jgi:hypothetical protein